MRTYSNNYGIRLCESHEARGETTAVNLGLLEVFNKHWLLELLAVFVILQPSHSDEH